MQLGGASSAGPRQATTIARALQAAAREMGHRPAITVLGAGPDRDRRDEQAYASLQQWTAKGAHLLEVDLGLGPGDLLLVDAPAGWLLAAVCHAAWWIGAGVTDDPARAVAAVVHDSRPPARGDLDAWAIGDAVDGTPAGISSLESWAVAVQAFPDQPPPSRASAEHVAVVTGDVELTQADLLAQARALPGGRLGVHAPLALEASARCLAVRPAATGAPVVLVVEADEQDLTAERVAEWAD